MDETRVDSVSRALHYAARNGISIEDRLGAGIQGIVFSTSRQTAVKVHDRKLHYQRERDAYLRLEEFGVFSLHGCAVPRLVDFDDQINAIEMEIVAPPFIVDFASAYLDIPPDYSEEQIAAWNAEKAEQFGEKWQDVQLIIWEFQRYGVFLADLNPGNIWLVS